MIRRALALAGVAVLAACGDELVKPDANGSPLGRGTVSALALTPGQVIPITSAAGDQFVPRVSGSRVVWADDRNGNWDIFLLDVSTGFETQITLDPADQRYPAISGERIVWRDDRHGSADIYLYDLAAGTETRITSRPGAEVAARISGDWIVWLDYAGGGGFPDLYGFNLTSGVEELIEQGVRGDFEVAGERLVWAKPTSPSSNSLEQLDLASGSRSVLTSTASVGAAFALSEDRIAWSDNRSGNGNLDLYTIDFLTSTETQITASPTRAVQPALAGNLIAWLDVTGGGANVDIFLSDPVTGTTSQLTFAPSQKRELAASEDLVVWTEYGSYGSNVFAYLLATDPGTTSPGTGVSVTPDDETTGGPAPVAITFDQVDGAGTTSVKSGDLNQPGAPDIKPNEADFKLGNPATYFDISTTATFSGNVQVCINYSGVSFGGGEKELLHRIDGKWEKITTPSTPEKPNPDPVTQTICGTTTEFSPFLVAETNARPVVTNVAVPPDPILVGSELAISAPFSDENALDTHTAVIDWGDGTTSEGGVTEDAGVGTVDGRHTYTEPGVYRIEVTVDDGGLTGSRSSVLDDPAYVVVYDPSGGFVTGGGWIDSPFGACTYSGCASDGSSTGRASFGFVAKYKRGANVPDGDTQFQFKAGDLNFQSTAYEWLVVAGSRAQFKGVGTINGEGDYGFMLTAIDGGSGITSTDAFRIKIIDRSTDEVVYDNKRGEDEAGNAATEISGGSIMVHNR